MKIEFKSFDTGDQGDLVVFIGDDLKLSSTVSSRLGGAGLDIIAKAAVIERFKGKLNSVLVVTAPHGVAADRLIVIGLGGEKDRASLDWPMLGGVLVGKLDGRSATIFVDMPVVECSGENAADLALGARLRAYKFDRYKTKKKPEEREKDESFLHLVFAVSDPDAAALVFENRETLAEGVLLARDLVNEPANILSPEEFAKRASDLENVGVEVEILDEARIGEIGMRALLAVGQGSDRESRVVIMRWNGAASDEKPVALIGKGVVFDSGGISIKPSSGMEDMKGDMAGAACIVGVMHALASRKAKVNVVGAIGLTENMPDGGAQRPGDIITTLSGQTVEVINTDAEGRLVLADVIWHVQELFEPRLIIDLATLTGAIIVALAQEYAGLFSNDDTLAEQIAKAGQAVNERVWRFPMGPEYDKMIDSKFADMKNTGGRYGGSITAAHFLKRFVREIPWAHLDIAGTGMNAVASEVNKSWGSGWGVRLLDRLIRENYEA